MTIGMNIRRAREAAKFSTQGAAAKALGWSQSRLSDLENDRYESVDAATLLHVAKTFSCSVEFLLRGIDAGYDDMLRRIAGLPPLADIPVTERELLTDLNSLSQDERKAFALLIHGRAQQLRELA